MGYFKNLKYRRSAAISKSNDFSSDACEFIRKRSVIPKRSHEETKLNHIAYEIFNEQDVNVEGLDVANSAFECVGCYNYFVDRIIKGS